MGNGIFRVSVVQLNQNFTYVTQRRYFHDPVAAWRWGWGRPGCGGLRAGRGAAPGFQVSLLLPTEARRLHLDRALDEHGASQRIVVEPRGRVLGPLGEDIRAHPLRARLVLSLLLFRRWRRRQRRRRGGREDRAVPGKREDGQGNGGRGGARETGGRVGW